VHVCVCVCKPLDTFSLTLYSFHPHLSSLTQRTTAAVLKLGRLRAQVGEYDSDSDSSDDEG